MRHSVLAVEGMNCTAECEVSQLVSPQSCCVMAEETASMGWCFLCLAVFQMIRPVISFQVTRIDRKFKRLSDFPTVPLRELC